MPDQLRGLGVSPGTAAGPLLRLAPPPALPEPVEVTDTTAEIARAARALREVVADLTTRVGAARDSTAADVLRAQAMMADDPVLIEAVVADVTAGLDAPHALHAAFAVHRQAFLAAGGYLAERVADLDDLRDRAVARCLGLPMPGIPDPPYPFVLAARDLAPADTALLDPRRVLALITEEGGPTSHTAIIARASSIPAVVRCPGAAALAPGTVVSVDGSTGHITVGISPADAEQVRERERARRLRLANSTGPGRTADGHAISLLANIGSARELGSPAAQTAEGVGLFRTELLYLDRATAPTFHEQVRAYADVFQAAQGRRVIIRTLDAGADKPLAFLPMLAEPNPALGMRGLRTSYRHPELLDDQLRAIAEAASHSDAQVWVMAPMVATADEAAGFAGRCRSAGLPTAGAMIEIPAAALRAAELARAVDFLSIGTNDLSQYAFAADRQVGDLADLLDPWQPALLSLIAMCAQAAAAAAKPIGVCGEAAADPVLALVLAGLGVTSLSMAPPALAEVRESLAANTIDRCRELADIALAAGSAARAREAVLSSV